MKNVILDRFPLGNKRFVWKQKDYVFSTFQCNAADMEKSIINLKEAGFNMVELGWASHEQAFDAVKYCEKYGLDLIFQDFTIMAGMQEKYVDRKVGEEVPKQLCEDLKDKKHTIGFYIWDEPYHDNELEEARRQCDMLEKYAPEKLLFTVAIPSYNLDYTWKNGKFAEYLEKYVTVMDPPVLSLDYYPIGLDDKGAELDKTKMWCDLGLMRKLAKKYDMPMWFYYQGCRVYDLTVPFSYDMVRAMIYGALLYGTKGLQHYTAADGAVIEKSGDKAIYFEDQKEMHRQLKNWGDTLMALESRYVFHSDEIMQSNAPYINDLADCICKSELLDCEALPARVSIGELSDAYGNDYLMILNRDFTKELKTEFKLKGNYNVYVVDKNDGKQKLICENVSSLPVELKNADACLLRLQKADQELCTIEYALKD